MNNNKTTLLVVGILAAIGFFVFSQSNPKSLPAPMSNQNKLNPTLAIVPTESKEVPLSSGTIDIEAGSFYFKPSVLKLKKGQKVTLKFKSMSMMHDFNIDQLNLRIPVTKSGNESTIDFTPDTIGEFEYYCSVGQHRQNGQTGKLIVVD